MNERMIMDRAGDLWMVEVAPAGRDGGAARARCRHELGYELTIMLDGAGLVPDGAILDALERARRREPGRKLAEAA